MNNNMALGSQRLQPSPQTTQPQTAQPSRGRIGIGSRAATITLPQILKNDQPTGKKELKQFRKDLVKQSNLPENAAMVDLFKERIKQTDEQIKNQSESKTLVETPAPRRAPAQIGSGNKPAPASNRATQVMQSRATQAIQTRNSVVKENKREWTLPEVVTDPASAITSIIDLISTEHRDGQVVLSPQGQKLAHIVTQFATSSKELNVPETLRTICELWKHRIVPHFQTTQENPCKEIPGCIIEQDGSLSDAGQEIAEILKKHGINNSAQALKAACHQLSMVHDEDFQAPSTFEHAEVVQQFWGEKDNVFIQHIPGVIRFLQKLDLNKLLKCNTNDLQRYLMQKVRTGACTTNDPLIREFCTTIAPFIKILEDLKTQRIKVSEEDIKWESDLKKIFTTVLRVPGIASLVKQGLIIVESKGLQKWAESDFMKTIFPYARITLEQSQLLQGECAKILQPLVTNLIKKHDISHFLSLIPATMAVDTAFLKYKMAEKEHTSASSDEARKKAAKNLEKATTKMNKLLDRQVILFIDAVKQVLEEVKKDPLENQLLNELLQEIKQTEWDFGSNDILVQLWDKLVIGWLNKD